MSNFLPPVVVELVANAKSFNAAKGQVIGGIKQIESAGEAASTKLSKLGTKITNGILMAGVGAAVVSLKMATDFEAATSRIITGAGESKDSIELVRKGMLNMAGEVGQVPTELAKGFYLIASAGFHGAEGLNVLKAAAQGAATGGAEMAIVADAVTTGLNNYGLASTQATNVTSALIQTVAEGKTNLGDLAGSIGKIAPTAAAMGISFNEVLGAMATMTAQGTKADQTVEGLRAMLLSLAAPQGPAVDTLTKIGLSADKLGKSLADPKKGLNYTLQLVTDGLGKKFGKGSAAYISALKEIMGGTAGFAMALQITGDHAKDFATKTEHIGTALHGAGKDVQGFAETQKTLQQQLNQLKGSASAIATEFGNWLLPKAMNVAKWAEGVIAYFKEHPLVSKIASDAAIGLFVGAILFKLAKGFQAIRAVLGFGKAAAQVAATTANTAALGANTAALLGTGGGMLTGGGSTTGGLPIGKKGIISRIGSKVLTTLKKIPGVGKVINVGSKVLGAVKKVPFIEKALGGVGKVVKGVGGKGLNIGSKLLGGGKGAVLKTVGRLGLQMAARVGATMAAGAAMGPATLGVSVAVAAAAVAYIKYHKQINHFIGQTAKHLENAAVKVGKWGLETGKNVAGHVVGVGKSIVKFQGKVGQVALKGAKGLIKGAAHLGSSIVSGVGGFFGGLFGGGKNLQSAGFNGMKGLSFSGGALNVHLVNAGALHKSTSYKNGISKAGGNSKVTATVKIK